MSVVNTLDKLKDANTLLYPSCYRNFMFVQGIDLYSDVDLQGNQYIKILHDHLGSLDDCQVLQIDGVPAVQAIKQFASENVGLARDLGVRFNMALSSLSADGTMDFSNHFSRRQYLPPTDGITYSLVCHAIYVNITRNWTACGKVESISSVGSSNEYWDRNCLPDSPASLPKQQKLSITPRSGQPPPPEETICEIIGQSDVTINNAQLLLDLDTAKFYQLTGQNVGIMTMSSMDKVDFRRGFQEFIDRSVEKVILDLTNIGGDYMYTPYDLNNLLFPQTRNFFEVDFRPSNLMQQGIQKSDDAKFITYPGELQDLGLSNDSLAPSHLPISGDLTFAIGEAYNTINPNEVLEFSYRPAARRLFYDEKSSRDPSELWVKVASTLLNP
ncbi:17397_t:CDS:2 [Acaulospora colombiana]|uniref:17397_t:CDS:1 n=1 Tax=Acaulospora colombiana TaxID=27376 RepID=A0ACA9M299_9GLOM|nr:17397_t:CDS:2 [Acaulospora colombiana]